MPRTKKRWMRATLVAALITLLSPIVALSQQPDGLPQGGGPGAGVDGPDGGPPGGRPGGRPGGGPPPRAEGGGPLSRAGRPPLVDPFERMRVYIDLVDRFSRLSRDPVTSAIAAVISAGDILKPRGTDAAIDYYSKLLPQVKNEAVQRAIRLQLVDLYKQAGQQDKALEQLSQLITAAPAPATTGERTP